MTEAGIPGYSGNDSKMYRRYLTSVVFSVIFVFLSIDFRSCSSSPVSGRGWGKDEGSKHALIHRRSLHNLEVTDPHEKCYETSCNRVTHYCDEVIRSCASCEDDCHIGRIEGDEQMTQDCLKKCDWYYYIISLKSKLCSTPETAELSAGLSDYQLFAIILGVAIACFTIIIVVIVGVFCYFFKKSSARSAVVLQETAGQSSSIYKPRNVRPFSSTDSKRTQNDGDTDIKLLANGYEDSLNSRTVQQESSPNSSYTPSSISLASNSQVHNCCNKTKVGRDQRQSASPRQNHTDSSTRQLV